MVDAERALDYLAVGALGIATGAATFGVGLWIWWANNCAPFFSGWVCR